MRYVMFAVLASALAVACFTPREHNPPVPVPDMRLVLQNGTTVGVYSPDYESVWFNAACREASERGESVVVLQGEKFVCLINP